MEWLCTLAPPSDSHRPLGECFTRNRHERDRFELWTCPSSICHNLARSHEFSRKTALEDHFQKFHNGDDQLHLPDTPRYKQDVYERVLQCCPVLNCPQDRFRDYEERRDHIRDTHGGMFCIEKGASIDIDHLWRAYGNIWDLRGGQWFRRSTPRFLEQS
jgi:hypothetical protein